MKVLYLFNKVLGDNVRKVEEGKDHDSWLFGMLRLSKYGIETDFLEIEKYIPVSIAKFMRRYVLTMHYAHIPLFPFFFKYNIIFTSTAYGCLFLKALFRIRRFKWIILDFNILGTIQRERTLKQKIFAWSIEHGSDGIVAISKAETDALKIRFPHLSDKIIFLHEATDTEFFQPSKIEEKNQIISVGNYGRDFETVIEAVRDIDTELLIVGKFPKDKIKSLPSNIKVVQLNHRDILKAYAESKISVVSLNVDNKYFDSVGTFAVIESMSMGKATIVTHTKSMESYIQDGVNGIFVPEKNITLMKESIVNLLKDDRKRLSLGIKARGYAEQNFNPEKFAEELADFMKSRIL